MLRVWRLGGALQAANSVLGVIEAVSALLAGAALVAAILLIVANTVMRHLFGSPITFSFTLVESYLLVMSLALGLPWGYRTRAWISVTFLSDRLSGQNKHLTFRLGCLIALPYVFALFWLSAKETYDLFVNNEHMFGVISWPLGWSWIWVPIGLVILTFRVLLDVFGVKPPVRTNATQTDHVN